MPGHLRLRIRLLPRTDTHEQVRQPRCNLGEEKEKDCTRNKSQEKRKNTFIDHIEWYPGDVSHDKDANSHRRDNNADHDGNTDHDAEPDRVVAKLDNGGIEDRCRKDHKSEIINKGVANQIDQDDKDHDHPARDGKPRYVVGRDEGDFRNREEVAQHNRPGDQKKRHHCSPQRFVP